MLTETSINATPVKKQAQAEKAKNIKKLLRILNELNHDVYICIQDKKTRKIHQFSSDLVKFGNTHIAEIISKKDLAIQKVSKFNSCLTKIQDKHLNSVPQEGVESSAESKISTEASLNDVKSDKRRMESCTKPIIS
jgi:ethanolamine utilization protein EutP (predicted NTPase)